MKDLLLYAVNLLVSEPEKVKVIGQEDGLGNINKYLIEVSKNDTKAVIGKEGKTIKAIRSLVSMAAINKGIRQKIPVEITEI